MLKQQIKALHNSCKVLYNDIQLFEFGDTEIYNRNFSSVNLSPMAGKCVHYLTQSNNTYK